MLDFKPITKELLIREGRSLRRSRIQICDYTPGCLYIWRHYYHMRCAEADGMFIFESGDGSGLYYNCPVGTGDFSAAVLEARDDAEKRGIPLRFSCIPSEYVDVIQSIIGRKAEIVSDRASADYLYPYEQFCGYNGKALHGQRNHVNRFKAEHPDFSFEMLTGENLPEAESSLCGSTAMNSIKAATFPRTSLHALTNSSPAFPNSAFPAECSVRAALLSGSRRAKL